MPPAPVLFGPDGRAVRQRDLTREAGRPTLTGVRQTWRHESVASGLTPQRLPDPPEGAEVLGPEAAW